MVKKFFLKLFQGFFIGISLVLPGMSGGTALIILGFYRTFLKDISELKIKRYLIIAVGVLIGVLLSSFIITRLLSAYPGLLVSFLMGMLIASVKLVIMPGKIIKPNFYYLFLTFIGFIIAWNLINEPLVAVSESRVDSPLIFFAGGILTSATMLLPGVSGSSVLILINLYDSLLFSVVNLKIWPNIITFTVGLIGGVLIFSRVITVLYNSYKGFLSYFLAGLLLGSTKALLPGEITSGTTLSFLAGLLLVLTLTFKRKGE